MKRLLRTLCALALVSASGCGPSDDDDVVECEANLLAGDLVVTEIMANPEGDDEGNEWFEIYNATSAALDLNGLVLIESKEDLTGDSRYVMRQQIIEPGDYLVLGGVATEFKPAHVDYGYGDGLDGLNNTAGRLALQCGSIEVDEVIHGEATSGKALGLDGTLTPDYSANDNLVRRHARIRRRELRLARCTERSLQHRHADAVQRRRQPPGAGAADRR
ncbi:MAG: lamin tail domain-containing protein [Deltaproteobacteria bacterium]|nr:lamin tail domain-containing protein [Deltaproteobacteria bacterium]